MKFRTFIFFLLLFAALLPAQIMRDTIAENLKNATSAPEKIKLYRDYAEFFATKDFSRSIDFSHKGLKLAKKLKNKSAEGEFLRLTGNAWYISGKLDSASHYYYRSLSVLKDQNAPHYLAELYNNLGRFYRKTKDFPRALKNYDLALALYAALQDDEGIATVYNESGVVYEYLGKHDEAVRRYKHSLAIQKKRKDLVGQGYSLEFIGGNYMLQKKYRLAEKFLLQSLDIRHKTKDDFALAMNYNVLGHLFLDQNKFTEAEKNFLNSNKISTQLSYLDLIKDNYENLAKVYRALNRNEEAYINLENFRIINDSLFTLGKSRQIEELSLKYETAEKDRLLLIEKSKVVKRNTVVFSLLGLLITGFIYYKYYQNRQKIKLQREILHQQNLATQAVMSAEDNERKRMATHLHDGIGQLLSAANMNMSVMNEFKKDEENFDKIHAKTKSILAEAMTDVRSLSHQIMPNMLINNTLANALQDLAEKTSSPKLQIHLKTDCLEEDHLNQNVPTVLYRVIQECINNTIKHAQASEIQISVIQNKGIEITYSDNGIGFSAEAQSRAGFGLNNIKSRIEMLKGELQIEGKNGEGTTIYMKIPC